MNEFDFVVPPELPFKDGTISTVITAANVEQITRMLQLAAPMMSALVTLPDEIWNMFDNGQPNPGDVLYLFELLTEHGTAAIDLVAVASNIDRAYVASMLPDRFAHVFALVVEVNASFFAKAAASIKASGERIQQARSNPTPTASLLPSASSSKPATATPTS